MRPLEVQGDASGRAQDGAVEGERVEPGADGLDRTFRGEAVLEQRELADVDPVGDDGRALVDLDRGAVERQLLAHGGVRERHLPGAPAGQHLEVLVDARVGELEGQASIIRAERRVAHRQVAAHVGRQQRSALLQGGVIDPHVVAHRQARGVDGPREARRRELEVPFDARGGQDHGAGDARRVDDEVRRDPRTGQDERRLAGAVELGVAEAQAAELRVDQRHDPVRGEVVAAGQDIPHDQSAGGEREGRAREVGAVEPAL